MIHFINNFPNLLINPTRPNKLAFEIKQSDKIIYSKIKFIANLMGINGLIYRYVNIFFKWN